MVGQLQFKLFVLVWMDFVEEGLGHLFDHGKVVLELGLDRVLPKHGRAFAGKGVIVVRTPIGLEYRTRFSRVRKGRPEHLFSGASRSLRVVV